MLAKRGENMTNAEIQSMAPGTTLSENETLLKRIFDKDSVFNLRYVTSRNGENRYFIAYFDGMVNNQIIDFPF